MLVIDVKVKLIGVFKEIFGEGSVFLKVDSTMLKEVILKITEISPRLKEVLFDPELDDPRPNAVILLNGTEINLFGGLKTPVKDGDEIVIIPVIHGG